MTSDPHATPRSGPSRRRHPRADLATTAILFSNRFPFGPGLVEDLSAGGLRVVLGSAIRLGRMVSVLLDLPGREPLLGLAQVARHVERAPGEHMLALSFLQLGRAEIERLEGLIAERLAGRHTCLEFFDTDDDGRPRRMVLTDDTPLVG
jgi:hypothetical protein